MAVQSQGKECHPAVRFCCVFAWRYFTGSHMDGKIRRHRNGTVLPRFYDYYWNRYTRRKRALIRNLCFWVLVGIIYGYRTDWPDTKLAILSVLPFLGWRLYLKVLNNLTSVTRYSDSNGVEEMYRVLRPKWRRRFERLRPRKIRWRLPDAGPVSTEEAKPMLAQNAVEGGAPITSLRRLGDEAARLSEPRNGRVATIMRHHRPKGRKPA